VSPSLLERLESLADIFANDPEVSPSIAATIREAIALLKSIEADRG
jgi:hypothetical protein